MGCDGAATHYLFRDVEQYGPGSCMCDCVMCASMIVLYRAHVRLCRHRQEVRTLRVIALGLWTVHIRSLGYQIEDRSGASLVCVKV
jgi:hypothetical protein